MTDLRIVCEQVFKNHLKEIREIGYNSFAIQSLVERDYPQLDKDSITRAADVIQLMLMNQRSQSNKSA
jgi:hypothetical protein